MRMCVILDQIWFTFCLLFPISIVDWKYGDEFILNLHFISFESPFFFSSCHWRRTHIQMVRLLMWNWGAVFTQGCLCVIPYLESSSIYRSKHAVNTFFFFSKKQHSLNGCMWCVCVCVHVLFHSASRLFALIFQRSCPDLAACCI